MPTGASRCASIRIRVGLRVPPPATSQPAGARGNTLVACATAAAVIAVSVATPSSVLLLASRPSSTTHWRKALRSSDLGGGLAKNGCASTRATASSSTLPAAAARPSSSLRLPGPQPHEVVDQRIAGAGVEGDEIGVAVDEGHVGDAAEIEHADRMRTLEQAHQGAMEDRHDRGALPAGGDIGGAEVIDHGNPQPGGERRPIAELDREAAFGPVQNGLAVETDHARSNSAPSRWRPGTLPPPRHACRSRVLRPGRGVWAARCGR